MFQSRLFITTATRFFILLGIIVSVHGRAQNENAYIPVFDNFNKQVDVFEGSIEGCLINITAKTYDGTVANINFQLKNGVSFFEIDSFGCLKIKPGMMILKTDNNPTLPVVIAVDTRHPHLRNEITININFKSSNTNVNRESIKIQSSHWLNNEHDTDDDDKKNTIGISETIEPNEPIMTVTNMLTPFNDKDGIFRFENQRLYANKDKLDFKNKNGIGMRDFDLIIVATNDQHQYQYRKIKIKTLRSRGSPPRLPVHKSALLIDEKTDINECICKLDAGDPDSVIGSTIYFEILKSTSYFSIDENGCIKLKEALDHECTMSHYNCPPSQLKVGVFFEGHFLETVASFEVVVDHAPELQIKNATIHERKKSKLIAKLTAVNRHLNGTGGSIFSYQINHDSNYPDSEKFEIKNGNELHNTVPLYVSARKTNKYEIPIIVKDNKNPNKANTLIFTVEVIKKNGLKFVQSKYVAFVSTNLQIDTPVTKYFWVVNNSGPVDYKILHTDYDNHFSVAKEYDSDINIYYGQVVVKRDFNYKGKSSSLDFDVKASDNSSSDVLAVRIYFTNANESPIVWNPLGNSYSALQKIDKDSVECIATVNVSRSPFKEFNPVQYNISEVSSERHLGSSTYSEEVVKSLFVKINKDTGCIQIQKYNGFYHNELMVVRAYYKYDDSLRPFILRRLIRIRLENPKDEVYNFAVTDET